MSWMLMATGLTPVACNRSADLLVNLNGDKPWHGVAANDTKVIRRCSSLSTIPAPARGQSGSFVEAFHGRFSRSENFGCKTAQCCAIQCGNGMTELPCVRNGAPR